MRTARQPAEVTVTDGRGTLTLASSSGPAVAGEGAQARAARPVRRAGVQLRPQRQLIHPDCELLRRAADAGTELAAEYAAEIIPVYPASAKCRSWKIAKAIRTVLDTLDVADDPLPAEVRERYGLSGRAEALHGPSTGRWIGRTWTGPRLRLKWDEAFVLQAVLAQRRRAAAALPAMPRPRSGGRLADAFDARLPFTLTEGQVDVGETITTALCRDHPMHRLLQGEVGSGKTVIAVRAMLQVVDAGGQAALLAPTEVLAQQHYRSITDMLGPLARRGQLGGGRARDPGRPAHRVAGRPARRAALSGRRSPATPGS